MPRKRKFQLNDSEADTTTPTPVASKEDDQAPSPPTLPSQGDTATSSDETVSMAIRTRLDAALARDVEAVAQSAHSASQKIYNKAARRMAERASVLAEQFDTSKSAQRSAGTALRITVVMTNAAHDAYIHENDPLRLGSKSSPFSAWADSFFEAELRATMMDLKAALKRQ